MLPAARPGCRRGRGLRVHDRLGRDPVRLGDDQRGSRTLSIGLQYYSTADQRVLEPGDGRLAGGQRARSWPGSCCCSATSSPASPPARSSRPDRHRSSASRGERAPVLDLYRTSQPQTSSGARSATAAYQIEGAVARGRPRHRRSGTRSATRPARSTSGDTGDVACDHYHRWPEDVALMRELGVDAYRLLGRLAADPARRGRARSTPAGLDFYDRLVDGLLERGHRARRRRSTTGTCRRRSRTRAAGRTATPPSASPSTPRSSPERLGDRVHALDHAQRAVLLLVPGLRQPAGTRPGAQDGHGALAAAHHLLLGHGLAVAGAARRAARATSVGITLQPAARSTPVTDSRGRPRRGRPRRLLLSNRLFTDPVLLGPLPGAGRRDRGGRSPTSASCRTATSS